MNLTAIYRTLHPDAAEYIPEQLIETFSRYIMSQSKS